MKRKPLILLNLKKTRPEKALSLMGYLSGISPFFQELYEIAVVAQPFDVCSILKATEWPVFVHDIYPGEPLHAVINDEYLKEHKVAGILTNHPDNSLSQKILYDNCCCARKFGLKIIIGSASIDEALDINDRYFPDYIAIENRDLIGKDISFKSKYPVMVKEAVETVSNKLLFGAGVRTSEDVQHVIANGGSGVLISSIVIGANDPAKALMELLECGVANL